MSISLVQDLIGQSVVSLAGQRFDVQVEDIMRRSQRKGDCCGTPGDKLQGWLSD